jgi:hypothetical protein
MEAQYTHRRPFDNLYVCVCLLSREPSKRARCSLILLS